MNKPLIIGVAGGTASGKSSVSRILYDAFSDRTITLLRQDDYYNDQSPRYDLHKAMHFLSFETKSLFIMESISPDVKDYCYALKGVYKIVDNSNVSSNTLVEVVNMTDELRTGNNTYLSKRLKQAIIKTKDNDLQVY